MDNQANPLIGKSDKAPTVLDALGVDPDQNQNRRCICSCSHDRVHGIPRDPRDNAPCCHPIKCVGESCCDKFGSCWINAVSHCGFCALYFLIMIFSIMGLLSFVQTTIASGKQWPTLAGGDKDNFHVLTHQANVFGHVSRQMSTQVMEGETRTFKASTTASTTTTAKAPEHVCLAPSPMFTTPATTTADPAKSTTTDPDATTTPTPLPDGVERQQSKLRFDWVVDVVIKHRKKGGNLFTMSNIAEMKKVTDIFYKDPEFKKYCWKKDDNETCAYSPNAINDFFPSITKDKLSTVNGHEMYMAEKDKTMMGYMVQGTVMKSLKLDMSCNMDKFTAIPPANMAAITAACGAGGKNLCSKKCRDICEPVVQCMMCNKCVKAGWAKAVAASKRCPLYYATACKDIIGCSTDMTRYLDVKSDTPGQMAVFDGKGKDFAPCELDSTVLASQAPKSADLPLCSLPHFYLSDADATSLGTCLDGELSKCDPKVHIGKLINGDSCALCNGQHCKCTSTPGATSESAKESYLKNYYHNKRARANIGKEFKLDNLKASVLSFNIYFGAPLKGFDNSTSGKCEGFGCTGAQTAVFRREYANEIRRKIENYTWDKPGIEFDVYLWWPTMLFDTFMGILAVDMSLVVFSILFVFIYMAVHTRSVFLSAAAMLHILMSLPLAFCVYTYIFRIEVFYFLNFMSVYIILAIGADDVFVFMDAFNQFSYLSLYQRLRLAYYRASKAMLITSLTTCGAFLVTAINSLNDIACFGIFTASLVAINFFYVITYYTATVLFYERFVHYCCCVCTKEKAVPSDKSQKPYTVSVFECCICDPKRRQFYIDRNVHPMDDKELEAIPESERIHRHNSMIKSLRRAALRVMMANRVKAAFQSTKVDSENVKPELSTVVPMAVVANDGAAKPQQKWTDAGEASEANLEKEDTQEKKHEVVLSGLDKFCAGPFYKFITKWPKYVFVGLLTAMAIAGACFATQLGYTTEAEQALQSSHPMQRWISSRTNDFPASSDSNMKNNNIVFGIKNPYEDRVGVSRYSQEDPLVVDDESFDPSTPAAQQFLVDICEKLPTAKEGSEFLVRQDALDDQKEEVNCFMLGLKNWVEKKTKSNSSWPIEQAKFAETLDAWLAEREAWQQATFPPRQFAPHEQYETHLYMDPNKNGVIKYAAISMNSTLGSYAVEYQSTKKSYDSWESWMNKNWKDAPAELQNAYHTSVDRGNAWVFMHTQEVLLQGAFVGITVSLGIAYVVLAVSTFNPYIALLATINIAFVVCCILGGTWLRGWEMGTIESISATILVGLSVDYVVHFANAYIESDTDNRNDALQDALIEMGGTVLGGAVTSLGASFMLFVCQFQYFAKFGFFMFLTIFLSFLYVFLFFVPLLAMIGPDAKCCAFCDLRPRTLKKRREEKN